MILKIIKRFFIFFILLFVKLISQIFYKFEGKYIGDQDPNWTDLKLIMLINHTSLYEPLFLGVAPISLLWLGSSRFLAPGADKTLERPIVGWFYKNLVPRMISISRKRDHTWDNFLSQMRNDDIILIAPEGRMMRKTGLDFSGNEMSMRAGVSDIIRRLDEGKVGFIYSGGLHHVQTPGQFFPKIFKTLFLNIEVCDIKDYKESLKYLLDKGHPFKKAVVLDLEKRKDENCPKAD